MHFAYDVWKMLSGSRHPVPLTLTVSLSLSSCCSLGFRCTVSVAVVSAGSVPCLGEGFYLLPKR